MAPRLNEEDFGFCGSKITPREMGSSAQSALLVGDKGVESRNFEESLDEEMDFVASARIVGVEVRRKGAQSEAVLFQVEGGTPKRELVSVHSKYSRCSGVHTKAGL